VVRADDDGIGQMVYELLEPAQRNAEPTIGGQEPVVDHLTGETALEVEDQWNAPQTAKEEADQGALVQVGVDDVRPSAQSTGQRADGEQGIEGDFVKGRAYLVLATPGDAGGSYDVETFNVLAVVIGADSDSMAESLECEHLDEDADVTAVVGKEGGRGEDQDFALSMSSTFFRRGSRRIAASCRLASLAVRCSR